MISKSIYVNILIRVLLLLAGSLFLGWLIFHRQAYVFAIIPSLFILGVTINLIYFLNRINRRIFYFFDAIKNEDSTLRFPNNVNNKVINDLNQSLQKVNAQIQQIYLENRKQEQYFQALLEHAATGMFTFNEKGFILHSNNLARQLFDMDVLTHINQLDRIDPKLYQTIKEIQPTEQRLVTLHLKSGVIQLLIKSNSFISENNSLMLISVHDIKNQLDEKELESWRKLIRVMMHEIMNSITPVTSLSESLAGYFYKNGAMVSPEDITVKTIETTIRGLEVIREQGKGLINFVESYRKITRLPAPEKKVFQVKNLIDHIRILSSSFENAGRIEFSCNVTPSELELHADEKQISQVLINLVKNACQANEGNENAKIQIEATVNEAGRATISVTDNGPGISDELMDKIFIPFFTTKDNGSGIGLSISRQIMQLHGGSLKMSSVPEKYTSAVLEF
ncbi:Histidine kinase-, DNA gyrase B-, and HSP90-like ATPase [Draconibacterium orientale]|uniref:histidine kinase n=1 Tax=Draconibacterium orientale TaxID=1168034 RepID=X5DGD3_9BACT|nr:ATP-binding protein [Draconibacterium orientale]AHW59497.1 histidine kinase [Draconibacterium orientale]SES89551.1 Histidine kinase-, DNA gyrase B-, and HSP90-like ATPase [Draconibacterium orientale]